MIPLRSATAVVFEVLFKFKLLKCIWLQAGLARKGRILFERNQTFKNVFVVHFSFQCIPFSFNTRSQ